METLFTGHNRIHLSSTESTQDYAEALLDSGNIPEGTLVTADVQNQGRGFSGTKWESAPGKNLLLSLIFLPAFLDSKDTFYLNKIAALSVCKTVRQFVPEDHQVLIKWPNDILIDKKKVAGILLRNQVLGGKIKSSVWGIGLNVKQQIFNSGFAREATSLEMESGKDLEREAVLKLLIKEAEIHYLALRAEKKDQLDREFLSALFGYGEALTFEWDNEIHTGIIAGVSHEGKLAVDTGKGLRKFDMKEIRFLA